MMILFKKNLWSFNFLIYDHFLMWSLYQSIIFSWLNSFTWKESYKFYNHLKKRMDYTIIVKVIYKLIFYYDIPSLWREVFQGVCENSFKIERMRK